MRRLLKLKNEKWFEQFNKKIDAVYNNPEDLSEWFRLDITILCKLLRVKKRKQCWKGVVKVCEAVQKFRNCHAHIDTQTIDDSDMPTFQHLFTKAWDLLQQF